jgi:hypothetical protein
MTRTYRNVTRREGKYTNRWDYGRWSQDGSDLPYMVAWSTGGADRYRAKPYVHPPWEPDNASDEPQFTWEDFPRGFGYEFETMVEDAKRVTCVRASATSAYGQSCATAYSET